MKKFFMAGVILCLTLIVALSGCGKDPVVSDVTNGLVACYPLNGNANDSIGSNGSDITDTVNFTQDRFGNPDKAALFDGGAGLITIFGFTLSPSNSFSVSLWIKTGASVNQYPVYCSLFGFRQEAGTTFKFNIVGTNTSLDLIGNVTQNTWSHIVGTYDDSTKNAVFYINGQSVATGTKADALGSFDISGLCLGTSWIGAIDDFRIYNRVLTGNEVNQLYQYHNN